MAVPQLSQGQLDDLLNSGGTYAPGSGYAQILAQYGLTPQISTNPGSVGNFVPPNQNGVQNITIPTVQPTNNPNPLVTSNLGANATSKLVPSDNRGAIADKLLGTGTDSSTGGGPGTINVNGLPGAGTTSTTGTTSTSTTGTGPTRPAPNPNPSGLLTDNPAINNAILAALSAVSGALSGRPVTTTNAGNTVTNPVINPTAQSIISQGGDLFNQLNSDTDLSGYLANQTEQINQNAQDEETSLEGILASRGVTSGPAAAAPLLDTERQRFGAITNLQNQIPLLQKQVQEQVLQSGQGFLSAIPEGASTTTSSTQVQSGNELGGALAGLTGILALMSGINSNKSTGNPLTVNNYDNSSSQSGSSSTAQGGAGGAGGQSSKPGGGITINVPGIGVITVPVPGNSTDSGGWPQSGCMNYDYTSDGQLVCVP